MNDEIILKFISSSYKLDIIIAMEYLLEKSEEEIKEFFKKHGKKTKLQGKDYISKNIIYTGIPYQFPNFWMVKEDICIYSGDYHDEPAGQIILPIRANWQSLPMYGQNSPNLYE